MKFGLKLILLGNWVNKCIFEEKKLRGGNENTGSRSNTTVIFSSTAEKYKILLSSNKILVFFNEHRHEDGTENGLGMSMSWGWGWVLGQKLAWG